ncbi:seryl-tRNA synthetase [Streptococcus pyogenes]|nr:seryl-tRNA synthetase [Streptococcus pyogenes]
MLDLKRIRTDFDTVAAKLKNRGVSEDTLTHLKELDEKRRTLLVQSEELKAERNIASAAIAQAKRQKKMPLNKLLICKKSLQISKLLTIN